MTGWRVAFACGNATAIKALGTVKSNIDSGVFTAVQDAAIEALRVNAVEFALLILVGPFDAAPGEGVARPAAVREDDAAGGQAPQGGAVAGDFVIEIGHRADGLTNLETQVLVYNRHGAI